MSEFDKDAPLPPTLPHKFCWHRTLRKVTLWASAAEKHPLPMRIASTSSTTLQWQRLRVRRLHQRPSGYCSRLQDRDKSWNSRNAKN